MISELSRSRIIDSSLASPGFFSIPPASISLTIAAGTRSPGSPRSTRCGPR
jgi:hypothetical protein